VEKATTSMDAAVSLLGVLVWFGRVVIQVDCSPPGNPEPNFLILSCIIYYVMHLIIQSVE
jgi:hypothetical protein